MVLYETRVLMQVSVAGRVPARLAPSLGGSLETNGMSDNDNGGGFDGGADFGGSVEAFGGGDYGGGQFGSAGGGNSIEGMGGSSGVGSGNPGSSASGDFGLGGPGSMETTAADYAGLAALSATGVAGWLGASGATGASLAVATAIMAQYGTSPAVAFGHLAHDIAASTAWGGMDALQVLQ
jgi:hypothetical protein